MVNTIYLLTFVEAPRKFINLRGASTKLNNYNLGLIVRVMFGNFAKIGRAAGASQLIVFFKNTSSARV